MSDVKELVDEYVIENIQLRQQVERLLSTVRSITILYQDDKGKVRIPAAIVKQAEEYNLQIKQLKNSVILHVELKEVND